MPMENIVWLQFLIIGNTMPKICENWLHLVNSYIYYAHWAHEIYQILPYLVDFKAPGELWNPLNKKILVVLFEIDNL